MFTIILCSALAVMWALDARKSLGMWKKHKKVGEAAKGWMFLFQMDLLLVALNIIWILEEIF